MVRLQPIINWRFVGTDCCCCWSLLCSAVLRSRADSLRSHVILHEWLSFHSAFLSIHRSSAIAPHCKLTICRLQTIVRLHPIQYKLTIRRVQTTVRLHPIQYKLTICRVQTTVQLHPIVNWRFAGYRLQCGCTPFSINWRFAGYRLQCSCTPFSINWRFAGYRLQCGSTPFSINWRLQGTDYSAIATPLHPHSVRKWDHKWVTSSPLLNSMNNSTANSVINSTQQSHENALNVLPAPCTGQHDPATNGLFACKNENSIKDRRIWTPTISVHLHHACCFQGQVHPRRWSSFRSPSAPATGWPGFGRGAIPNECILNCTDAVAHLLVCRGLASWSIYIFSFGNI